MDLDTTRQSFSSPGGESKDEADSVVSTCSNSPITYNGVPSLIMLSTVCEVDQTIENLNESNTTSTTMCDTEDASGNFDAAEDCIGDLRSTKLQRSSSEKNSIRIEGWLNVWEKQRSTGLDSGRVPLPIWEPHFCVLQEHCDRRYMTHFRSEAAAEERSTPKTPETPESPHPLRLDGGKHEFDRRWGYEALECIKENAIQHPSQDLVQFWNGRSMTMDGRTTQDSDSGYERKWDESRRSSVPVICDEDDDTMESPQTPSRIASFFSRRGKTNLKRTKSVTKLDRKRATAPELEGEPACVREEPACRKAAQPAQSEVNLKRSLSLGRLTRRWAPRDPLWPSKPRPSNASSRAAISSRLRSSRSHESLLLSASSMASIRLNPGEAHVRPLHSSLLGQEHCFQVHTENGSKYYSCRTQQECDAWIDSLRRAIEPRREHSRRSEHSLNIWLVEAKNIVGKKRYFCELLLDRMLCARTSCKPKAEMLFWGEHFTFSHLPPVETITVNLYREAEKKKKKEKNTLVGYVKISVSDIRSRQLSERWYAASSTVVGKSNRENKGELPLIRIKARFQSVDVLPMSCYTPFIAFLRRHYVKLVGEMEPVLGVSGKEELAVALVNVFQSLNAAPDLLSDIVMCELLKLDNESLTFRGNTIATKAMEAYMKLVAGRYLRDTMGDFVRTVLESDDNCEVDPAKLGQQNSLQRHQTNLVMYCEMAWFKIINSHCFFPRELSEVFARVRQRVLEADRSAEVSQHLVSACIFLRFLCPAILSPSLFHLTQEYPSERPSRSLTLIAKTIQTLANFTQFGAKEEYMTFMNDFVESETTSMRNFVQQISSVTPEASGSRNSSNFLGFIDRSRELSVLHALLAESMVKLDASARDRLSPLARILSDLTYAAEHPNVTDANANPPVHANIASPTAADSFASPTAAENAPAAAFNESARRVATVQTTSRRNNEQQVEASWNRMVNAAGRNEYVDLMALMDELDSSSQATHASSGYQSVSPTESLQHTDSGTLSSTASSGKSSGAAPPPSQPLSFTNPLFTRPRTQPPRPALASSSSFSSDDSPPARAANKMRSSQQNNAYSSSSCESLQPNRCKQEMSRSLVDLQRSPRLGAALYRHRQSPPPSLRAPRRNTPPPSPISRRLNSAKFYEEELTALRLQLTETQNMLQEATCRLNQQQSDKQLHISKACNSLPDASDYSRVALNECGLLEGNQTLQDIVSQKQQIIDAQEKRIHSLDAANTRLLQALNTLKDKCAPRNGSAKLSLAPETSAPWRSSNC